jgi:hypothetical protein
MDRYKRKKYYDDSLEEFILRKFFNWVFSETIFFSFLLNSLNPRYFSSS